jgi:hypothetical protein
MDTTFFKSIFVGVLVMLALYLALSKSFEVNNYYIRRALGLFSGVTGLLVTFWLLENQSALEKYVAEIVVGSIGVVFALFAFAKKKAK